MLQLHFSLIENRKTLEADNITLIKTRVKLLGIVPHTAFNHAGFIGQVQRDIGFAVFGDAVVFIAHQIQAFHGLLFAYILNIRPFVHYSALLSILVLLRAALQHAAGFTPSDLSRFLCGTFHSYQPRFRAHEKKQR